MTSSLIIPLPFIFFSFMSFYGRTIWAEKVLFVGDSNSKQFGQRLENLCIGTVLDNAGIGGSTAAEWSILPREIVSPCNEDVWDIVYISVGANDIETEDKCGMSEEESEILLNDVVNAIHNVMTNIAPGAKTYFMTGYCLLAGPNPDHEGCEESQPSDYTTGMSDILPGLITPPEGATFEIVNSIYACGGSETTWSDDLYFRNDGGHINLAGYCKVFTQPEVEDILSCENSDQEIECDDLAVAPLSAVGMGFNCADLVLRNKIRDSYKPSSSASSSLSFNSYCLVFMTVKVTLFMGYFMG